MTRSLFRTSVCLGLSGMIVGIVMGIRQDFTLVPVHAHLNLLGFVTMFLSALYYRVVPEAAADPLAAITRESAPLVRSCSRSGSAASSLAGIIASSRSWWRARSRSCSACFCSSRSCFAPRERRQVPKAAAGRMSGAI
jgi:hypothetical protein